MTTAREDTARLSDLLRREHHALAEFLVALSDFDRARRWEDLGYKSLFSFLVRELRLSNGAAQNRKTAAELIRTFPQVGVALRDGKLCLSSVNEVAKVITPENVTEILPRFFGLSARDAAFESASIRPVPNPPRRDFFVTPVRSAATSTASTVTGVAPVAAAAALGGAPALHTSEVPSGPVPLAAPSAPASRPSVRPLDAERARVNMTVSRRLLEKLAAARDALSHSHPGASEETILELGSTSSSSATGSGAGSDAGRGSWRRSRRRPRPRALPPPPLHPLRRSALATSPLTSGAGSGSGTGAGAPGPSRAAASADRPASSSSITSTALRAARRPRSRGGGCSAVPTSSSPPAGCTATRTCAGSRARRAAGARSPARSTRSPPAPPEPRHRRLPAPACRTTFPSAPAAVECAAMRPWEIVERVDAPDGAELVLARRDDEWVVRVAGRTLMSSRAHGSEEALAAIALRGLEHRRAVLVGGLGMGYTLRATLDRLPVDARVVVVELVAGLVAWNRGPLAALAGRPLDDPRVRLQQGDVGARIAEAKGAYDAILLDVDNGPSALAHAGNRNLYGDRGVRACAAALRAGGVLAVWSAGPDERFRERLERAGLAASEEIVPARAGAGGLRHVVIVGRKPAAGRGRVTPPRRGAAGSSRAGGRRGRG